MTGRETIAGSAALGLGVGVAGLVAILLHRTLRPVEEIRRYTGDIAVAASGIVRNVAGASGLTRTRELAVALPGLVVTYLERTSGGAS